MQIACPRCKRTLEFSGERPLFCAYCACPLTPQTPPRTQEYHPEAETLVPPAGLGNFEVGTAPSTVGGYRLARPIGNGGMGVVYEAEELASGRKVALKLISPEFAASPDTIDRFRQEGRLASMIAHPRCVFVLAADEEAGRPYIVMELMSGSTLHELIQKNGPLPLEDAIAKILDVIDGLQEAHRLGVIHRDVKPSNCFLEPDGRVKIGDFGLSKSLVRDLHLTRTGAFMGTPLYASPEQVRADRVDERTDVYSVAATLYFLLTGKAPFETGDAAATLARIVSDPAPSMRTLRPDIPAALDKIVLRGLEKDCKRRFGDLEPLREALMPFLPAPTSIGSIALRIAAFGIDCLILFPLLIVSRWVDKAGFWGQLATIGADTVPFLLYFSLLEGLLGYSVGKRLLRLRVHRVRHRQLPEPTASADGTPERLATGVREAWVPGLRAAAVRAVVFYALTALPTLLLNLGHEPADWAEDSSLQQVAFLARVLGWLAIGSTMRRRNGYCGLHEWVSDTRVVGLPWQRKRRKLAVAPVEFKLSACEELPETLGSFEVQGMISSDRGSRVLLAQDAVLGRRSWISVRPVSAPPLSQARQQISRASRSRWLSSGKCQDFQWDAFLAPAGCPLPDMVKAGGRLSWADAHLILEQLVDELAASSKSDCLPSPLSVDQVWVESSGRVQLVDVSVLSGGEWRVPRGEPGCTSARRTASQPEALELLRQVSIVALEGCARPPGQRPGPVRAPLPQYARTILDRLIPGRPHSYTTVDDVQRDLAAVHDRPTEVTAAQRAAFLWLHALVIAFPVLIMFVWPSVLLVLLKALVLFGFSYQIEQSGKFREQFEQQSAQDALGFLVDPDPLIRTTGAFLLSSDEMHMDRLAERINQFHDDRHRLSESSGLLVRLASRLPEFPGASVARTPAPNLRGEVKSIVEDGAVHGFPKIGEFIGHPNSLWIPSAIGIGVWLPIWVIWAFIWRGGIALRMAGLTLLRADGRNALRIQCAWRVLLVWAPVTALLLLSCWLDTIVFVNWVKETDASARWAFWLSWISWIAALSLLPAYVALALRSPARALHDRLAGTYLMPR